MRIHHNGELLEGIKIKKVQNNIGNEIINKIPGNNFINIIPNDSNKNIEIKKGGNRKFNIKLKDGNLNQETDI